jgi:hypothetical protein
MINKSGSSLGPGESTDFSNPALENGLCATSKSKLGACDQLTDFCVLQCLQEFIRHDN